MVAGSSAGDEAARNLRAAEELRRKAARLERRAAAYARGRHGELVVAQALEGLTADGYLRIDDCRWPGRPHANIDHVLVGPAGLFVVDAKNWSGRVEVRAGVLRQSGYRRSREVDAIADAARVVSQLLPMGIPRIASVICLCGEAQIAPTVVTPNCSVVPVGDIADWIRRQPALLMPPAVVAIHGELLRRLEPASRSAAQAAASPVPDFIPQQWPSGAVHREVAVPSSAKRSTFKTAGRSTSQRFSRRSAVVGRTLLLLFMLDAVGTAAASSRNRAGDLIVFVIATAWLVRLERRRPVVINSRR